MPPVTHRSLLLAAHRALAAAQLGWVRHARLEAEIVPQLRALVDESGREKLDDARRERLYSAEEATFVARHSAYLAAQAELLAVRPLLSQFLPRSIPVGSSSAQPRELLGLLVIEGPGASLGARGNALARGLEPYAARWVEARVRARQLFCEQLDGEAQLEAQAAREKSDLVTLEQLRAARPGASVQITDLEPDVAAAPAVRPDPAQRAARFLEATDDPTQEVVRWLARGVSGGATTGGLRWPQLFAALRARELDGLARPSRRFFRLAEAARRMGFERDMGARMRGELGLPLLAPRPAVIALDVPGDVRVVQPGLEWGVLSDLAAAQGIGTGLAQCLVSPALGELARWPVESGVSAAFGALYVQLRAEPSYLARIEGVAPEAAERLARHAAIFGLLRTRLYAALYAAERVHTRSERELLQQLTAAAERALGVAVDEGLTALTFLASSLGEQDFSAAATGLDLHAALRERFDEDWYLNPRVNEVLRGACARGNLLGEEQLCRELDATVEGGIARALELL